MLRALVYYGLHSFVNQIKKLCKTWFVVFILVCALFGGLIGFTAAMVDENIAEEETIEIVEDTQADFFDGIDKIEAFETIFGIGIVIIFVSMILSADDKGIMIFQPADVNILFTSPNSPQSVLMFRVFCQMGLYIFFTIYFMIEIPVLKDLLSLTSFQAAMIILTYGFSLISATFTRIYFALLQTKYNKLKKYSSYTIYILIALVLFIFLTFWQTSGLDIIPAALSFFNARLFLYVPLIGWLKGIFCFAISNQLLLSLLSIIACILFNFFILILIKNMKVDFYEEAMHKTEELSRINNKMQENNSLFVNKTKKKIISDKEKQLNPSEGASMFFIRSINQRLRFARFRIITKTLVTYLLVGTLCSILMVKFESKQFAIPALIISMIVFFRTMGNPLREDTNNIYFLMAPLKTSSKLFFSLLAGSVNCLLDILPAMIVCGFILKTNILEIILWLFFIISLDMFSTCAGAFSNLSLPENAGSTVKQVMQMMFMYLAMIPDILIVAIGLMLGADFNEIILFAIMINILATGIFFTLTVTLIEPHNGQIVINGDPDVDLIKARSSFSKVGLMCVITYVSSIIVQLLIINVLPSSFEISGIWTYLFGLLPLYFICMPLGILMIKNNKRKVPIKTKIDFKRFIKFVPVMTFFLLSSSIFGNLLNMFFANLFGASAVSPVEAILNDQNFLIQILFVVLIGPFFEELFFRKIIIDNTNIYGEKTAIILSAFIFGLFHGNTAQTTYAMALGLLLGYVYIRSGSLKYSFILHAMMNFFHGVLPSYLLSRLSLDELNTVVSIEELANTTLSNDYLVFGIYYLVLMALAIVGLLVFIREKRKLYFVKSERELLKEKRFKIAFINPGMICFTVLMLVLIFNEYLGFLPF